MFFSTVDHYIICYVTVLCFWHPWYVFPSEICINSPNPQKWHLGSLLLGNWVHLWIWYCAEWCCSFRLANSTSLFLFCLLTELLCYWSTVRTSNCPLEDLHKLKSSGSGTRSALMGPPLSMPGQSGKVSPNPLQEWHFDKTQIKCVAMWNGSKVSEWLLSALNTWWTINKHFSPWPMIWVTLTEEHGSDRSSCNGHLGPPGNLENGNHTPGQQCGQVRLASGDRGHSQPARIQDLVSQNTGFLLLWSGFPLHTASRQILLHL